MYFYLKKPNSGIITPINLHYYINSKEKYFKYPVGKSIHPDSWSFENRLPKTTRGAAAIKSKHLITRLTQYCDYLEKVIRDCENKNIPVTKHYLKTMFDAKFKNAKKIVTKNQNIVEVMDLFIKTKNGSGGQSLSWNKKYNNLRRKLMLYDLYNKKPTLFRDVDQDWIDSYCGFARSTPELLKSHKYFRDKVAELQKDYDRTLPVKRMNDNTLNRNIKFLFTFLKWSYPKYHNINVKYLENPVKVFQSDDVYLTMSEVESLEKYEAPTKALDKVRDLFLIGIYSGQRFSDYSVLEKEDLHGDIIIKRAEKTESDSFIHLHPKLKRILDKYDWKLPKISSQKFNVQIQKICRNIGMTKQFKTTNYVGSLKEVKYYEKCDMVTSHTARRTFITLSAERGMRDHVIMKITGIRDPKTLLKYKKTTQEEIKESTIKVW